jgi:transcriptional regulator with XRE-family HTH domain
VILACINCGGEYESVLSDADERKTCSRWCSAMQKRKWEPWNPLQRRCVKEMARTKSSLTQFAKAVGIGEPALGAWFRNEGRATARANLEKLAAYLGIPVEQAIAEAGGTTAEEGRSARGRARGAVFHAQAGTATSRKRLRPAQEAAQRANRGRRQSTETVEKRMAARKATGGEAYTTDRLVEFKKSPVGRAVHSVLLRLGGNPSRPSEAQRDAAYAAAAQTSGLRIEAVKVAVRPYLLRHGLVYHGGRRRGEARHDFIVGLLADRGLTPADDAPWGFFTERGPAFPGVRALEGEDAPDSPANLYRWWLRYKRACPHCLTAVPAAQNT